MKLFLTILFGLYFSAFSFCTLANGVANETVEEPLDDELLKAVQIYTQDELLDLIKQNKHLERVKEDRCQLNRDIEDRAVKLKIPAYQFLYGDMLAWGVCVERDAQLGLFYIRLSAEQGLVAAIEQLGRYYDIGRFVQKDQERAYQLTNRAAELGNLNAQFRLVQMNLDGVGSPYDFENSYRWLHHAVIADQKQHAEAADLLMQLSKLMNPKSVKNAKKSAY
ncbi:sel1 repeat family protein [Psychrosphaera sp. F3M07]|jgi:TPR repeat protein|uniref:Tetratricopeptide repeat protein n=1 Tax=Psychrosphaera aquimarina TaxID=2044854 RepID=A0ABU3R2U1_9GAMM|nr:MULTISPECIES: tetratricopeptide repeat protein [Psychrosphaera]MBU2919422.1 sel1 repeat family protein [Psychrosphaera sp. F3M07]MDU0113735.1 tetratricopeptide repeat protein [Psychrosphaera aquimarina]